MNDDLYEFKEVENLPLLKRSRNGIYSNLLEAFNSSGKSTVLLNWKGKAGLDTVAVSLRKAVKTNPMFNINVISRSRIDKISNKRVVYEIYLTKTKETEHKKKGK